MAAPYLVADSAQVTVLRSLASTAFGKYGLNLPEGIDLEDVHEVAAPGNELAYVSSLGRRRRVGGMFRRFVRADVSVTAQGEGMVPASDVERVLDEAAQRVSGDFFLESDITRAGLGPWVPLVDFHVGDIVNVGIWGRVVPLAVTRIEPKRTDHSDNDWSVHVGGQLLSDAEARLAQNAEIYSAVVSDRRELAGVSRAASEARRVASSARSVASDAEEKASAAMDAVNSAEGIIQSSLDEAKAAEERGRGYAQDAHREFEQAKSAFSAAQALIDEAERLVSESDAVLDKNAAVREEIARLRGELAGLHERITAANAQMGVSVRQAAAQAAAAGAHTAQAMALVDDAEEIRKQIAGHVEAAERAIAKGEGYVQSAFSHAEDARTAVGQAQEFAKKAEELAGQAQDTLKEVNKARTAADASLDKAGKTLTELQQEADAMGETLSRIDQKQNEVLAAHEEVLEAQSDINAGLVEATRLNAEGVKAAGAAAGSAAMGAMWAQLTAEDAARAAGSALDAADENTKSIKLLDEVTAKHSKAMRELGDAQKNLKAANDDLVEANKKQQQINEDVKAAQDNLEATDLQLEQTTQNLEESQRLSNQAIRATAGAAGMAGMVGMHAAQAAEDAAKAAESALEAGALNRDAILAADYTIRYNKLIAENYSPKVLVVDIKDQYGRHIERVRDESEIIDQSKMKVTKDAVELPTLMPQGSVFVALEVSEIDEILGVQRRWAVSTGDGFNGGIRFDIGEVQSNFYVSGVIFPMKVLPKYQRQLDALNREYRAKGLPI